MNAQQPENDMSQKPWTQMTYEERAAVYYEYALKVNDIDWYMFHGVDPRRPTHN